MFLRITIFLIGIICTVYALTNIILYLNLFVMGYTFIKYVNFIIRSGYFILLLVGLLILYLSIFKGGRKLNMRMMLFLILMMNFIIFMNGIQMTQLHM